MGGGPRCGHSSQQKECSDAGHAAPARDSQGSHPGEDLDKGRRGEGGRPHQPPCPPACTMTPRRERSLPRAGLSLLLQLKEKNQTCRLVTKAPLCDGRRWARSRPPCKRSAPAPLRI